MLIKWWKYFTPIGCWGQRFLTFSVVVIQVNKRRFSYSETAEICFHIFVGWGISQKKVSLMKVFQDNTQLLIKLSQTYLHEEHRHTLECVFFFITVISLKNHSIKSFQKVNTQNINKKLTKKTLQPSLLHLWPHKRSAKYFVSLAMWMAGFQKKKLATFQKKFKVGIKTKRRCSELYAEPSQTSKVKFSTLNYFLTGPILYFTWFWIRLSHVKSEP